MRGSRTTRARVMFGRLPRRHVVWASLLASMSGAGGMLLALDDSPGSAAGAPVLAGVERGPATAGMSAIFETKAPIEPGRWTGIVIHHSSSALGSAETLTRQHVARGFRGLGYHFVISNGQGGPDGGVFVGYRWQEQLPGVHVMGPKAEHYNRQTIGICLVGDGERRGFTQVQMERLAELVSALQSRLGIPDGRVVLHREVAPTSSPGRRFPEVAFRQMLADAE